MYPSVTIGPIAIEKAIKGLNWKPTDLFTALTNSINFFNDKEIYKYEKENSGMIEEGKYHGKHLYK